MSIFSAPPKFRSPSISWRLSPIQLLPLSDKFHCIEERGWVKEGKGCKNGKENGQRRQIKEIDNNIRRVMGETDSSLKIWKQMWCEEKSENYNLEWVFHIPCSSVCTHEMPFRFDSISFSNLFIYQFCQSEKCHSCELTTVVFARGKSTPPPFYMRHIHVNVKMWKISFVLYCARQ